MSDQNISASDVARALVETAQDKFTAVVGAGAVTTHLWLPILQEGSAIAAYLAPPAGLFLIGLQCYAKVLEIKATRKRL